MSLSSRAAFAVVVFVGVVGTGLAVAAFSAAGYRTLGSVVWIVGYGTTIAVLWWGWLRPLEFPSGGRDEGDASGDGGG
jgi:hypothetical protein